MKREEMIERAAKRKAAICELIDDMVSDAVDDKPDKERLTFAYYVDSLKIELKLLIRLLKERV